MLTAWFIAPLMLSTAAQTPAWQLSARPIVEIGVVEGDQKYELFDARSSIRLLDGRIVVLNAGGSELRLFDAKGKFVKTIGRKGAGPGEFRFPARLYYTHRDSMLVYDSFGDREHHLTANGDFVAVVAATYPAEERFKRDHWAYGRFLIDGPPIAANREPVLAALRSLPDPPAGEYRYIRIDPWGRLWLREPRRSANERQRWTIYDERGRPTATLVTPPNLEIHQIGPDFILGRSRSDLDAEIIQLWGLSGAGAKRPGAYFTPAAARMHSPDAIVDIDPEVMGAMRAFLRSMMSAQEIHYSRAMTYSADASRLKMPEDKTITVHLLRADERGWAAIAVHKDVNALCMVSQGNAVPGWSPGRVVCGNPRK